MKAVCFTDPVSAYPCTRGAAQTAFMVTPVISLRNRTLFRRRRALSSVKFTTIAMGLTFWMTRSWQRVPPR